jgi:hypothetical protein
MITFDKYFKIFPVLSVFYLCFIRLLSLFYTYKSHIILAAPS